MRARWPGSGGSQNTSKVPGFVKQAFAEGIQPHQSQVFACINKNNKICYILIEQDGVLVKKKVSMIRKYHNHTLQTNPRHCEEEPQNINSKICLWISIHYFTQNISREIQGCHSISFPKFPDFSDFSLTFP